ncbi:pathway-specific regulatory protein [Penicillium longicatenatum]|uniref:pathway-specific regulatory protein n=1 Tax=Penicillium longicatenatum TaxID=1561947 RepID=UPI00254961C0|nr:pathway-specific regulatory protein [Penicillium longicatenatum]KAJ5644224.1 pathway-specific regulatory protein [Penicillium longicatenatum]
MRSNTPSVLWRAFRLLTLNSSFRRYSMDGPDDFGYSMRHKAIRMAEPFGIVNNAKGLRLEKSYISTDMISSLKRTAWGLFQIDTIVHMNFLRPSHIKDYFDESCKLSFIARDTSWKVPHSLEDVEVKQGIYNRLRQWKKELPQVFELKEKPAPYILVLRMRYHTLVINLYCYDLQNGITSSKASKDACGSARPHQDAMQTALFSAREIATLIEVYRAEYGLVHCHQFAMYAINVSLFCILAQESFQILDPDFLSLTSAFSVLACRSRVGRHLFHAFKLSVRSRDSIGWMFSTDDDIPPGIKDLFGPREKTDEPDKWDHYAEGLAEIAGEVSFLRELGMDPAIPGLLDMLKWYEVLSIGKETKWRGKDSDHAFLKFFEWL